MIKRGPYKTELKKRKFRLVYEEISDINRGIDRLQLELECFIRNENWDEAISRQKHINEMKIRLLELGKEGWDIKTRNYPTLT